MGRASRGRHLEDLERAVEAEWASGREERAVEAEWASGREDRAVEAEWASGREEGKGEESLLSTGLGQARREGLRGAREAWAGEEGWEEVRCDGARSPTQRGEEARRREQSAALSPNRH